VDNLCFFFLPPMLVSSGVVVHGASSRRLQSLPLEPDPERPGPDPGRQALGGVPEPIADEHRLLTPLVHDGRACANVGPEVQDGLGAGAGAWTRWPIGGAPPNPHENPPATRSVWNMSTNSCCSSSKLSCKDNTSSVISTQATECRKAQRLQIWLAYGWRGLAHHLGHLPEEVAHPRHL
jgi:hypothetical protein